MKVLAIDLGGTSAKVGLIENKRILKTWNIWTNKANVWKNLKSELWGLNLDEVDVIGLSVPGLVDHENGIIKLAGNLEWRNYDAKSAFLEHFNKPVYVINDANAAALGEYWMGSGKDYRNIIFYTIGTGIGGGVVVDDQLVYGKNGYAGEFGHGGFFQSEKPCSCGLQHCIEPISSATGISEALRDGGYDISVKEAGELLTIDKNVKKIFKDALRPLAMHISAMQFALNPEAVIIGGGPSNIGNHLRQLIDELVREYQLQFICNTTPILLATTTNDAGMWGAAYWALTKHQK